MGLENFFKKKTEAEKPKEMDWKNMSIDQIKAVEARTLREEDTAMEVKRDTPEAQREFDNIVSTRAGEGEDTKDVLGDKTVPYSWRRGKEPRPLE